MADPVLDQLNSLGLAYEVVPCDPDLADTAAFCEAYGYAADDSANAIVVVGKSDPPSYVMCLVLSSTRLDVNRVVRKRLGVRRASFASAAQTKELTGMEIGGVHSVRVVHRSAPVGGCPGDGPVGGHHRRRWPGPEAAGAAGHDRRPSRT